MILKDKVAVVVGGGSGIGEATAKLFASEGAKVVLVARTKSKLDEVVSAIKELGGSACSYSLDVSNTNQVEDVFKTIADDNGPVDVLVNSAGVFYQTPGGEMLEQEWRTMIDINLCGTINTCNAVLPSMKERQTGHIVNIASMSGLVGGRFYSIYGATKAAVINLSKSLAAEFAPYDVHLNVIAPGNTATPINEAIRNDPENAEELSIINATTPSKRKWSQPIDIARSALFLCSDGAAPYFGAVFVADEGTTLETDWINT